MFNRLKDTLINNTPIEIAESTLRRAVWSLRPVVNPHSG